MARKNFMKYEDVVADVSDRCGYSESTCRKVMKAMIDSIFLNVVHGKTVHIENFGDFKLKYLNRRTIPEHIISGETAVSPAHVKISFKEENFLRLYLADVFRDAIAEMNRKKDEEEDNA